MHTLPIASFLQASCDLAMSATKYRHLAEGAKALCLISISTGGMRPTCFPRLLVSREPRSVMGPLYLTMITLISDECQSNAGHSPFPQMPEEVKRQPLTTVRSCKRLGTLLEQSCSKLTEAAQPVSSDDLRLSETYENRPVYTEAWWGAFDMEKAQGGPDHLL